MATTATIPAAAPGASEHAVVGRRVLLLGSGHGEASWRFRIQQYLPHLRARGMVADTADLHRPWPARLRILSAAARYDVVCVHRALLSPLELALLRRSGARVLFDFDDAIMFRDSTRAPIESHSRRRRATRMFRAATAVVAGNAYLADFARAHNRSVTVLPTAIDLAPFRHAATSADGHPPTIGWIGTRPNLHYLRAFLPALARLARGRPDVRLDVVCDAALEVPGLPVRNKRWALEDEVADLRGFDVGIMPLPDDAWTRGKCALKILQYFAAGVPVVCSPVGTNRDVVEPGRNGFFATSDEEWIAHLTTLLADPDLRRRFGAHGRALVEQRYSVDATLPRLVALL